MRRTKVALVYKKTGNLRACQLLLGQANELHVTVLTVRNKLDELAHRSTKPIEFPDYKGLSAPGRTSVRSRLIKLNKAKVVGRRDGHKAKEAMTARPGRLHVESPWDVWQIDHTLADVIVVDSQQRKPIGRPWLTVVIDVASRLVVGFYVGLEPPSILRAAVCLEQAVSDKAGWLRQRNLDYDWPARGLPKLVHSDRASEFRSRDIVRALANQGVDTFFRPPGAAHWGGHVERLIGTLMGECRMLPGATHSSPKARGDYDSCKGARLTIDDLEMYFARQIVGIYNRSVHASLGCSPLEAWKDKAAGLLPRSPDDADHFRLDLFPHFEATITRTGIKKFGQEYASADTTIAFASGVRRVLVKYDPRNPTMPTSLIAIGAYRVLRSPCSFPAGRTNV